jgi:hypothetical protein
LLDDRGARAKSIAAMHSKIYSRRDLMVDANSLWASLQSAIESRTLRLKLSAAAGNDYIVRLFKPYVSSIISEKLFPEELDQFSNVIKDPTRKVRFQA